MKRVSVGELAHINPRLHERPAADERVSFVPMSHLDDVSGRATTQSIRPFAEVSKGYTPFQDGDLLVAKITPCFENGKIGQAHLETRLAMGSTEFHVVRPNPEHVDSRYLLHFLRQREVNVEGRLRMTGSGGQRRVPADFLSALTVPLPRLDEQRRIAAILDQTDEMRATSAKRLHLLDRFELAAFERWVSEQSTTAIEFRQLAVMRNGLSPSTTGTVVGRVLTLSAVTGPRFDGMQLKEALFDHAPSEDQFVNRGDFLVCRGNGNRNLVGTGHAAPSGYENVAFPDTIIAARLDASKILPEFLELAWKAPRVRAQVLQASRTTSGIYKINQQMLGTVSLEVPSVERQVEIRTLLGVVSARRMAATRATLSVQTLFSALQSRAFSGEL